MVEPFRSYWRTLKEARQDAKWKSESTGHSTIYLSEVDWPVGAARHETTYEEWARGKRVRKERMKSNAKRRREPPFHVYGTADYFQDRDRLFSHGMYTMDRRVKTLREALDAAYALMNETAPRGPNAYVLIEKRSSWGTSRLGEWNRDNWGQKSGEKKMSSNRRSGMKRNADDEPQTYIVEYYRTDDDDFTQKRWGIFTCAPSQYSSPEEEFLDAIEERFIEEVWSAEAVEKGDVPEKVGDDRAIYHMWLDYEAAMSEEEMEEAQETGEWPDIEQSTEYVEIIQMIPVKSEADIEKYQRTTAREPDFDYDMTE